MGNLDRVATWVRAWNLYWPWREVINMLRQPLVKGIHGAVCFDSAWGERMLLNVAWRYAFTEYPRALLRESADGRW